MTARIPTQRNISAVLAKAEFIKSVSTKTRIKGWRNYSFGYVVQGAYEGVVWVTHQTHSTRPLPSESEQISNHLKKYAAAIEAAGFDAERSGDRLVVTSKDRGTAS